MLFTHCWWMLASDDKTGAMHVRLASQRAKKLQTPHLICHSMLYLTAKASLHMALMHLDGGIVSGLPLSALFQ